LAFKQKPDHTISMNTERTEDAGTFPKVILLDTTNYCNLKCSMCGHRIMTREKGRMSMPLFRKIIDEIAEKDKTARVWMVFFGEALILRYKLLWQILYAKKKGLKDVVLNSNGCLLDEETSLGLIESGLDSIYIGIDAFNPETYSKIRVGGDYNQTVNNVNTLLDLKRKLGATNPKVFVQFVEMEENAAEIEDFTKYWTERGATVKIRPKVTWAGKVDPWKVQSVPRYPCYWAMRTFNICWDGRVVLCSVDYDARFVAGDINNESIQSVWLGSLKKIREYHTGGGYDSLPSFCRDCTDWQMAKAAYY
jgi:MoaA/NifB/PqqE/SkfB family radical SAM enzyme